MTQLNPFEQQCLRLLKDGSYINQHITKRAFFMASLFMEGQPPAVREKIAEYFGHYIMTAFSYFTLSEQIEKYNNRFICDYQNNQKLKPLFEKSKTLIAFFKEQMLRQQGEVLPLFKSMLVDLESRGDNGLITWAYQEVDRVKKVLPNTKFDTRITHGKRDELHQKVKTGSRKKNAATESMFYLFFMMAVIYIAVDTYNNYKNNDTGMIGNVCITMVLTLLIKVAWVFGQSMSKVNRFRNFLTDKLILQLEFVPPVEKEMKSVAKEAVSEPVSRSIPPVTESVFSEHYKLRVIPASPVSLYGSNENKDRQLKRWQLPFWSKSHNDAPIQETKQESIETLPSEFGPALSDVSLENFTKLEGGSLGPKSQLYGVWLDMEDPCAMDLHDRFLEGKLVPPEKPGIKRLVVDGSDYNYYEVKGSGAPRVIGRELVTVNQKTLIVFSQYDSSGLHAGHSVTRRILAKVDSDMVRLHEINQNVPGRGLVLRS